MEEGDETVCRLIDAPLEDPRVQDMKTSILASIALEEESSQERGFRFLDLIWDRGDLRVGRRLRIAFLVLSFQQLMGQYRGDKTPER